MNGILLRMLAVYRDLVGDVVDRDHPVEQHDCGEYQYS